MGFGFGGYSYGEYPAYGFNGYLPAAYDGFNVSGYGSRAVTAAGYRGAATPSLPGGYTRSTCPMPGPAIAVRTAAG